MQTRRTLFWVGLLVTALLGAESAYAQTSEAMQAPRLARRKDPFALVWGPDLQIEFGGGFRLDGEVTQNPYIGRLRVGGLIYNEPWIIAAGPIGELGGVSDQGVGFQFELMHIELGLTWQVGFSYVERSDWTSHASVGLSVFAVEWQRRFEVQDHAAEALFLKVKLPLGPILLAFR